LPVKHFNAPVKKLRITPVQQMLSRFDAIKTKGEQRPQISAHEARHDADVSSSNLKNSATSSSSSSSSVNPDNKRIAHLPNAVGIQMSGLEK
jgi:hypothetical protein